MCLFFFFSESDPNAQCYSQIAGELECIDSTCQVVPNAEYPGSLCGSGSTGCITDVTCNSANSKYTILKKNIEVLSRRCYF